MRPRDKFTGVVAAVLLGSALPTLVISSAGAIGRAAHSARFCRSSAHPALAARLTRDIQAAQHGRVDAFELGEPLRVQRLPGQAELGEVGAELGAVDGAEGQLEVP